jgi:predicted ArsR family transcriptional regulator
MDVPPPADREDPLAQPTRARLFRLLVELKRAAGTGELAERVGLHPNGVRLHLEQLRAAGLVERERNRQKRGRPRDSWTVAPAAQPGGEPPSAYADLVRWLARAMPTGPRRLRDLENAGRAIGQELAAASGPPEEALETTLAALGFQPRLERGGEGELTFCLGNCPYRAAVRENPELICTLHRGLTRGMLDVAAPEARLAGFVARDPDAAGCLIEITGATAAG